MGALLVFGLLVGPAVTARIVTTRPYLAMLLSSGLALIAAWAGLFAAFYTSLPPSFLIVAVSTGAYALALVVDRVRRRQGFTQPWLFPG